jgi:hypothetical protein
VSPSPAGLPKNLEFARNQPQVSSQESVDVLIELGPILGYELSTNVIKRGGYKSREEFVRDLTARVGEDFSRQNR